MKSLTIMGYDVFTDTLDAIDWQNHKAIINTINPHSYVVAKSDPVFQEALKASDVLLADGSGIVLAAKQINNAEIKKIAGADLHHHLLEQLNELGGSCFYMGSSRQTLDKIQNQLAKDYPQIKAGFYSPPFKPEFSEEENNDIIKAVNEFSPDVLFIGMTAPKQEKWVHQHKDALNANAICSIGAVFDFYAGNTPRAPQWMISTHLEWLYRSVKSYRLFKRNFISNPIFLKDMFSQKLAKAKREAL